MSEKLWRKNLINIEPYVAGEQPKNDKIIKLNANENPYPPSSKVKAILEGKTIAELRKYPSADASVLRAALAERVGLKSENVFCGNGSDDVLATAFRAFFNSDKPILYPDITYSFYPVWCELLKIPYKTKSVDEDFVINIGKKGYLTAAQRHNKTKILENLLNTYSCIINKKDSL